MLERVLKSTGAAVRGRGEMYKAVENLLLFYGREIWMVTGDMLKLLVGFHHWVA